ncbi:ribonuclease D [Candidatus Nesciobacter abundans]|nr:ribonuclease D [Candidatus Nesciobacter abundans]
MNILNAPVYSLNYYNIDELLKRENQTESENNIDTNDTQIENAKECEANLKEVNTNDISNDDIKNINITFLQNKSELLQACQFIKTIIENQTDLVVAFDTEFYRRKTYWPILCLIQIRIKDFVFIIDCQEISIKGTFLEEIFSNEDIVKVCHACEQDIAILQSENIEINNCFDSQVGAMFVKFGHAISYQDLIDKILNVKIKKEFQDSNWNLRPIPQHLIEYAAKDVIYLYDCFTKLKKTLNSLGRFSWAMSETERKINTRGKNKTRLHKWRDTIAEEKNIPPSWLIDNKVMHSLCCLSNPCLDSVKKLLPKKLHTDLPHVLEILKAMPKNKSNIDITKSSVISLVVRIISNEELIPPSLICDSETIRYISCHMKVPEHLTGWRYEIFGKKIETFLKGKSKIGMKYNRLVIK